MEPTDTDPFRDLMLGELDAVHRLAFHLTLSREEAEDLVQEAYLRAFKSRETFRPGEPGGARPWLFKILHNLHRSRLERRLREPRADDDLDARPAGPPDVPPAAIDWEQVDDRLKGAIEALPPNLRAVLLLWAVEGLKYREIADVVGAPLGTVMSRLFRARQMLAGGVADLAQERRLIPAAREAGTNDPADGHAAASEHG